jgi:hypothetical protein
MNGLFLPEGAAPKVLRKDFSTNRGKPSMKSIPPAKFTNEFFVNSLPLAAGKLSKMKVIAVSNATYLDGYKLQVVFNDNKKKIVDF